MHYKFPETLWVCFKIEWKRCAILYPAKTLDLEFRKLDVSANYISILNISTALAHFSGKVAVFICNIIAWVQISLWYSEKCLQESFHHVEMGIVHAPMPLSTGTLILQAERINNHNQNSRKSHEFNIASPYFWNRWTICTIGLFSMCNRILALEFLSTSWVHFLVM